MSIQWSGRVAVSSPGHRFVPLAERRFHFTERKFPGPIYLFFFFIFSGPLISFMPDATETEFFERADMLDTKIGRSKKDAPTLCRQNGFRRDDVRCEDVVSGRTSCSPRSPT